MRYIAFDAANTLIHKPQVYEIWVNILNANGYAIKLPELRYTHHIVSELIHFPDRTSQDFYAHFNAKVLLSLGIMPTEELLSALFQQLTYSPWEVFADVKALKSTNLPLLIFSNFNSSLVSILETLLPNIHFQYAISEKIGLQKQNVNFYKNACKSLNIDVQDVIYIGDSPLLDVHHARLCGIQSYLIDRYTHYPLNPYRFSSMYEFIEFANSCQS